jgi:glyoxylate utilization-related uncharacterized protein
VDAADLRDFVRFEESGVVRETVFESDRLWAQLVCLDRNRSYGPVNDPAADAIVTVVAGEAVVLVDKRRKQMKQWGAVLVPAGAELSVSNASAEGLVLLMITAPPPAPRVVSG